MGGFFLVVWGLYKAVGLGLMNAVACGVECEEARLMWL